MTRNVAPSTGADRSLNLAFCDSGCSSSFRRAGWQGKIEGCALVHFRLRPYFSTVAAEDSLYEREAHAGALEFRGAVKTLENVKEIARVTHVETGTVVLYEIN